MRLRVAVLACVLVACGRPSFQVIPAADLPEDVYGRPSPGPIAPLPERGPVWFVRDGRLVSVQRRLPDATSLPEALIRSLLAGPSGVTTTAIPEDTRLVSVRLEGRVAIVNLSDAFERSAPGEELALRVAQVVYTVTEAPQVIGARFAIEGRPSAVIAGDQRVVERAVTRADYEGLAEGEPQAGPSPTPG